MERTTKQKIIGKDAWLLLSLGVVPRWWVASLDKGPSDPTAPSCSPRGLSISSAPKFEVQSLRPSLGSSPGSGTEML